MLLHCSKALAAKLPYLPTTNQAATAWSAWHGHLVRIDRFQCLLFCHDVTRYMLFLPGVRQPDFQQIETLHRNLFHDALKNDGVRDSDIQRALNALGPMALDTKTDRSVQGTIRMAMEDIKYAFRIHVKSIMQVDVRELTAYLNNRPCTANQKDIWPNSDMKASIKALTKT